MDEKISFLSMRISIKICNIMSIRIDARISTMLVGVPGTSQGLGMLAAGRSVWVVVLDSWLDRLLVSLRWVGGW